MAKFYCLTIPWGPVYDDEMITKWIESWWNDNFIYFICSVEKGKTRGLIHLQSYIELNKRMGILQLKEAMGCELHAETRKGTREQARTYCMKSDTHLAGPYEKGEWRGTTQGKRSDLDRLADMVGKGASDLEIFDEMPGHLLRFGKQIDSLRQRLQRPVAFSFRNVEVYVFWGLGGAGKTRRVWELEGYEPYGGLYPMPIQNGESLWFDGYNGEQALLLDDFDGSVMKYKYFLRIVDGYPLQVPVKGGFAWALWTRVYITANEHPENWWSRGMTLPLSRRITKIEQFSGSCEKSVEVAGNTGAATYIDDDSDWALSASDED